MALVTLFGLSWIAKALGYDFGEDHWFVALMVWAVFHDITKD